MNAHSGKYPHPGPMWTCLASKTTGLGVHLTTVQFGNRMVLELWMWAQCAKQVVSDSLGLVNFKISLVDSFLCLPEGRATFFGEIFKDIQLQRYSRVLLNN